MTIGIQTQLQNSLFRADGCRIPHDPKRFGEEPSTGFEGTHEVTLQIPKLDGLPPFPLASER